MPRKRVVNLMTDWYEITNSSVSKALQALAKPPHEFIAINQDPRSGREVVISLTPRGLAHCDAMVESAASVVTKLTTGMTLEEAKTAAFILMRMDQAFHR